MMLRQSVLRRWQKIEVRCVENHVSKIRSVFSNSIISVTYLEHMSFTQHTQPHCYDPQRSCANSVVDFCIWQPAAKKETGSLLAAEDKQALIRLCKN